MNNLSDHALRLQCGAATHQHFKGGLYRMLGPAMDASTGAQLVVGGEPQGAYEHLYPHERQVWVRSQVELDDPTRFRPLGTGNDAAGPHGVNVIDRPAEGGADAAGVSF